MNSTQEKFKQVHNLLEIAQNLPKGQYEKIYLEAITEAKTIDQRFSMYLFVDLAAKMPVELLDELFVATKVFTDPFMRAYVSLKIAERLPNNKRLAIHKEAFIALSQIQETQSSMPGRIFKMLGEQGFRVHENLNDLLRVIRGLSDKYLKAIALIFLLNQVNGDDQDLISKESLKIISTLDDEQKIIALKEIFPVLKNKFFRKALLIALSTKEPGSVLYDLLDYFPTELFSDANLNKVEAIADTLENKSGALILIKISRKVKFARFIEFQKKALVRIREIQQNEIRVDLLSRISADLLTPDEKKSVESIAIRNNNIASRNNFSVSQRPAGDPTTPPPPPDGSPSKKN